MASEALALRCNIETAAATGLATEARLRATEMQLGQAQAAVAAHEATIADLQAATEGHLASLAAAGAKAREEETLRRQLHNTIQELKGNIRVFCRVRPRLGKECDGKEHDNIAFPGAFYSAAPHSPAFIAAAPDLFYLTIGCGRAGHICHALGSHGMSGICD